MKKNIEEEKNMELYKENSNLIYKIISIIKKAIYKQNFIESFLINLIRIRIHRSITRIQTKYRIYSLRVGFKKGLLIKKICMFYYKLGKLQGTVRCYLYRIHHKIIFPKIKRYRPIIANIYNVSKLYLKSPCFLNKITTHEFFHTKVLNKFIFLLDTKSIMKEQFIFNFISKDGIIVDPSYSFVMEKNGYYYNTIKFQKIDSNFYEEARIERVSQILKNRSTYTTNIKLQSMKLKSILVTKNYNSSSNLPSIKNNKNGLKSVKWSKENIVLHY